MKGNSKIALSVCALMCALLAGCDGDGSSANNFDFQSAMTEEVASSETTGVDLVGTVNVGGNSGSLAGGSTLALQSEINVEFDGVTAIPQVETVSGLVTAAGVSSTYSWAVTSYYDPTSSALIGQTRANEYDVATVPLNFPNATVPSSGVLGTLYRYSDSSQTTALGTIEISYVLGGSTAAQASSLGKSGHIVVVTEQIYDMQHALQETDTNNYNIGVGGVMYLDLVEVQSADVDWTASLLAP